MRDFLWLVLVIFFIASLLGHQFSAEKKCEARGGVLVIGIFHFQCVKEAEHG